MRAAAFLFLLVTSIVAMGCRAPGASGSIAVQTKWLGPGDSIQIESVSGDRAHLEAGGSYVVEGRFRLNSRERASLQIWCAGGEVAAGDRVLPVARGEGRFRSGRGQLGGYGDHVDHGAVAQRGDRQGGADGLGEQLALDAASPLIRLAELSRHQIEQAEATHRQVIQEVAEARMREDAQSSGRDSVGGGSN